MFLRNPCRFLLALPLLVSCSIDSSPTSSEEPASSEPKPQSPAPVAVPATPDASPDTIIGHGAGTGAGGGPNYRRPDRGAKVRAGVSTVQGPLHKEIVRRFLRRHYPALKACYESELVTSPGASFKLETRFVIREDGKVDEVAVSGGSEALHRCFGERLESIDCPKNLGAATTVAYPFTLTPPEEDATPQEP